MNISKVYLSMIATSTLDGLRKEAFSYAYRVNLFRGFRFFLNLGGTDKLTQIMRQTFVLTLDEKAALITAIPILNDLDNSFSKNEKGWHRFKDLLSLTISLKAEHRYTSTTLMLIGLTKTDKYE